MLNQKKFIPSKKFVSNINKYKQSKPKFYPKQQQPQQQQPPLRRSNSADNIQQQQQQQQPNIKEVAAQILSVVDKKMQEQTSKVNNLIELKTKYYVDQRINVLENSNDLLTRGANELAIQEDPVHSGNSFMFKYNGDAVARITDSGWLYCRNIWCNGINLMTAINSIVINEQSAAEALSNYVKHYELKNGTYELNVKDTTTEHLLVKYDDNNTLDFLYDNYTALHMNTDRTLGYSMLKPNMSNGETIYGLRFGKDDSTGAQIRYTYSTTANNSYLALGPINKANTLAVYYDKRVVIDTANNLSQCLVCKYNGNLSNNQFLRIGCGDNRDTGIFAYGRANNANYLYLKLQGRSASVAVYSNYTSLDSNDHVDVYCTKVHGGIMYMKMANIGVGKHASIHIGKADANYQEISIGYLHDTTNPHGFLGFYGNDYLIKWDKYGNMNMNGLTATGSISCAGLYSSAAATVDGLVTCAQLDVANTTKNTWYAKFRCEDYLANNDYLRMIFKDLSKQAYIDFTRDTQYYKLKLYVSGASGMLTINETGLEFDGQVDAHNDVVCWQKLLASDIYAGSSSLINFWNGVVCQSNLQVDGLTQLKHTDISVAGNSSTNDALVITDPNLTSGHAVDMIIGQDENSSGNSSVIAYHYTNNNDANNYLGIGMLGYSELVKLFRDKIELLNSLYCTSIIVNGITVDVPNIAYTNVSNTFTQAQNISVDSATPLTIRHPTTITADTGFRMQFTDGTGSSNLGLWMDSNNKYYTYMKLANNPAELRVYGDKVNVTTTMNAKQYELPSSSTDYNSGFGYNFMKVLMDTVYPIGSIYMSMTELQNENYYPETSPNNKFEVWWHGCTWRLLDNGVFLRNGEFHVLDVSGSVDPDDPNKYRYYITGAGNTGGSATHNHKLSNKGWAKFCGHGANYWDYLEVNISSSDAWTSTFGGNCTCENKNINNERWGIGLGGKTEDASSMPPYLTCYMYQRIA